MNSRATTDQIAGCLLGIAAGDSLGLPYEGLSAERGAKLFPDRNKHHFIFGKGMISDDTEHACFVSQALIHAPDDPDRFARRLARHLRFWLMGLPAGVGMATGRAVIKLWLGFSPHNSGVFSAGNGPAMRSPLIGLTHGHDPDRLRSFVQASTRITHTDPKAFHGAMAVALAAHMNAEHANAIDPNAYIQRLSDLLIEDEADEFMKLVRQASASAEKGESAGLFAQSIGSTEGISGYIYHTVPCLLQVWFRFSKDYQGGINEIIAAGGDADTTAAILGGIIGAGVGKAGIPADWLANIIEYPRSVTWMERLATTLKNNNDQRRASPWYCKLAIPFRNLLFFTIVLLHGFRRLLPPY